MQDRSQVLLSAFAIVAFMALVGAGIAYEGASLKAPPKAQLATASWSP
jgi:hypothetical protein